MIAFVVITSDLTPFVLNTWMKGGVELSTDGDLDQMAGKADGQTL